jgi:hypothetical protein
MLVQNGLPILPSSVVAKSHGAAEVIGASARDINLVENIARGLERGLTNESGRMHSATLVLLAFAAALRAPGFGQRVVVGLCAAAAILANAAIGGYGWFYRYEMYLNALAVAALLVVYAPILRDTSHRYFFKGLALSLVASDALRAAIKTPGAAANIYGQ